MAGGDATWGLWAALAAGALAGGFLLRRRPPGPRAADWEPRAPGPGRVAYAVPPQAASDLQRDTPMERPRPVAPRDPGRGWAAFAFYLLALPGILWVASIATMVVLRAANVLKNDESGLLYIPLFMFVVPAFVWSFPWCLFAFALGAAGVGGPVSTGLLVIVGALINAAILRQIASRWRGSSGPGRAEGRSVVRAERGAPRPTWRRIAIGVSLLGVVAALVLGVAWVSRGDRAARRRVPMGRGPVVRGRAVICAPLEFETRQGVPAVGLKVRVSVAGPYELDATAVDRQGVTLRAAVDSALSPGVVSVWLRPVPVGSASRAARGVAWPVTVSWVGVWSLSEGPGYRRLVLEDTRSGAPLGTIAGPRER